MSNYNVTKPIERNERFLLFESFVLSLPASNSRNRWLYCYGVSNEAIRIRIRHKLGIKKIKL